jgi:hypothetical protein
MQQLISGADIASEYVDLLATASTTVDSASGVVAAVAAVLESPADLSQARRSLAAELFHEPGRATERATTELYALMELEIPADVTSIGRLPPRPVPLSAPVPGE